MPQLQALTARHVRHLLTPWWRAGWTLGDTVHALTHRPDGPELRLTDAVRAPAGWARARLAAWRRPDGALAATPHQLARRDALRLAAERAQRAAERAEAAARRVATEDRGEEATAILTALRARWSAAGLGCAKRPA